MTKDVRDQLEEMHKNDKSSENSDYPDKFESPGNKDRIPDQGLDSFEKSTETESKSESSNSNNSDKYNELLKQHAELEDQYKRLMADYRNQSNRMNKEREEAHKYASVSTVDKILPAIDNFNFALKSINEQTPIEEAKKSIEMLKTQLIMSLQGVGLQTINTDCSFDANFHEAVSKLKDPEKEEGTIIEVVKEGYSIGDRVVRAALVVVSTKE